MSESNRRLTAAAFDAGWDAKEAFDRGTRDDLVDMLTTHRHGKDKKACDRRYRRRRSALRSAA